MGFDSESPSTKGAFSSHVPFLMRQERMVPPSLPRPAPSRSRSQSWMFILVIQWRKTGGTHGEKDGKKWVQEKDETKSRR